MTLPVLKASLCVIRNKLFYLSIAGDSVWAELSDGGGPGPDLGLRGHLMRQPPSVPVPLPGLQILKITPEFLLKTQVSHGA